MKDKANTLDISILDYIRPSEENLFALKTLQNNQLQNGVDILSIPVAFCMLTLPYKELKNSYGKIPTFSKYIIKNNKKYSLRIESGFLQDSEVKDNTTDKICGIPYGTYAQLIYLYLFNQIKLKKSKTVHLGSSFRDILTNIKIIKKDEKISGPTIRSFNKQLERIVNASLRFEVKSTKVNLEHIKTHQHQLCFPFIKEQTSLSFSKKEAKHKNIGAYYLTVSDEIYDMIINNPFSVFDADLLHVFKKHPLAFNFSLFFSYWSYMSSSVAKKDLLVNFEYLHEQFGIHSNFVSFKTNAKRALQKITHEMPFLKLTITKKGVIVSKNSISSVYLSKTKLAALASEEKYKRVLQELYPEKSTLLFD